MGLASSTAPLEKAPESAPDELSPYNPAWGPFWCDRTDGEAVIRYAAKGIASKDETPARTIAQVLQLAADKRGDKLALVAEPRSKTQLVEGRSPPPVPREEWKKWTWKDLRLDARRAAKAMLKLGLVQHDAVTIFGQNCPEWVISSLGAQVSGGMCCGVYPSDTEAQFMVKNQFANASISIVGDEEKLAFVENILSELPYLKAVVCWGARKKITTPGHASAKLRLSRKDGSSVPVLSWSMFMALGDKEPEDALDKLTELVKPGHACSVIFTSGTMGVPKGCLLTHDNFVFAATVIMTQGTPHMAAVATDEERVLSYLPLSHVAGQMLDIVCPVVVTALRPGYTTLYFARPTDLKTGALVDRIRDVQPTIFLGVPRVWEKIAEKLRAFGAQNSGMKKTIAGWAKAQGASHMANMQLGGSGAKGIMYDLADRVVLSKIKEKLGMDKVKFVFSGAAPIGVDTLEYFGSLGLNVNEIYGMSECTAATTWSSDEAHLWGSVGHALGGMEVRVFVPGTHTECLRVENLSAEPVNPKAEGELCYRGRHIMLGYMANPSLGPEVVKDLQDKNREAIDEQGWLHSGDLGIKGVNGMFRITGRIKELIIGAGGENIAPVPIENAIKKAAQGVISNCVMLGDKQRFNVCLITIVCEGATGELPGSSVLEGPAKALVQGVGTLAAACKNKKFVKFIQDAVEAANNDGLVCPSKTSRVHKFTILPHDFSIQTGELTATLKTRRSECFKIYAGIIDKLYASTEQDGMYVRSDGGGDA